MSVTNTDNDGGPPTKFYVVDDAAVTQTFEYGASGASIESYSLGNTTPRVAASAWRETRSGWWMPIATCTSTTRAAVWGSWVAGTLNSKSVVEGIATDGTDMWIVDSKTDKVYHMRMLRQYVGHADFHQQFQPEWRQPQSQGHFVPTATSIWVVNDSTTDMVFKYTIAGASRQLDDCRAVESHRDHIDPSTVTNLWIVDSATDRVYQFDNAATRTSGPQAPSTNFLWVRATPIHRVSPIHRPLA